MKTGVTLAARCLTASLAQAQIVQERIGLGMIRHLAMRDQMKPRKPARPASS